MQPRPPFDGVPLELREEFVRQSLEHPLEIGGSITYGYVVDEENKNWCAAGYLAKLAGYPGDVRVPMYSEARQLWARAGFGVLAEADFRAYLHDAHPTRDLDDWVFACKAWFGVDPEKVGADL